jgi:hypothetical protein
VRVGTELDEPAYISSFRVVGVAARNGVPWRNVSDWHPVRIVDKSIIAVRLIVTGVGFVAALDGGASNPAISKLTPRVSTPSRRQ